MTYVIDKLKARIHDLETRISDLDKDYDKNDYLATNENVKATYIKLLNEANQRLTVLQNQDLTAVVHDMKIISEHVKAVEQKYECRTVKFLCAVAEFFEKPRSHAIATKIRNHITNKINAPVCSIIGNQKSVKEPMPISTYANDYELKRQQELEYFERLKDLVREKV